MRPQDAWLRQGAYGCCQCLRMSSEAGSHLYVVLLGSCGGRSLQVHLENPYWEIFFLMKSMDTGESNPGVCHVERCEWSHCYSNGQSGNWHPKPHSEGSQGKIIFTSFPVSSQRPGVTTGWGVPHAQSREAPSLVSGIHVTHVRSGAWVCSAVWVLWCSTCGHVGFCSL